MLVDENLPPRLAHSLAALFKDEHRVEAIADRFGRGIKDLDWISALAKDGGWTILTADKRISRNRIEREAFLSNNLVGFVLSPSLRKKPLTEQMARILIAWPKIVSQANMVSRGLFELGERSTKFKSL